MKNMLSKYLKLDKEILAFEYLAYFLLAFLGIYLIMSVADKGLENSINTFGVLGVLVSALLVSKVASRQLAHTDILQEDSRRRGIVRVTHHLMTVIKDLIDKVTFAGDIFEKGNIPISALTQCVADIHNDYKELSEKEAYEYLDGKSVELIWGMSGSIFGLVTVANSISDLYTKPKNTMLPKFNRQEQNTFIEPLQKLLVDLKLLDKQIRALRQSIELPADLTENGADL